MERYLLGFDFDRTQARTFEQSPQGMGVAEAYAQTVRDIFPTVGRGVFADLTLDLSRAPSELAMTLLKSDRGGVLYDDVLDFYEREVTRLNGYVPEGKGAPLVWQPEALEGTVAELLVRRKLHYLYGQIGQPFPNGEVWPRPYPGFLNFWQTVDRINQEQVGKVDIKRAVISSGHERFIQHTFTTWGATQPDILVTEDDIRGRIYPKQMDKRVKPGLLPMALALREWSRHIQKEDQVKPNVGGARLRRQKVMYLGDDLGKDGGMAQAGGILFGWFEETGILDTGLCNSFTFYHWDEMTERLVDGVNNLQAGQPLADVFITI